MLDSTKTMVGSATGNFALFVTVKHFLSGRFEMHSRIFGDEGTLLFAVEVDWLEAGRYAGQPECGDLSQDDDAYS